MSLTKCAVTLQFDPYSAPYWGAFAYFLCTPFGFLSDSAGERHVGPLGWRWYTLQRIWICKIAPVELVSVVWLWLLCVENIRGGSYSLSLSCIRERSLSKWKGQRNIYFFSDRIFTFFSASAQVDNSWIITDVSHCSGDFRQTQVEWAILNPFEKFQAIQKSRKNLNLSPEYIHIHTFLAFC